MVSSIFYLEAYLKKPHVQHVPHIYPACLKPLSGPFTELGPVMNIDIVSYGLWFYHNRLVFVLVPCFCRTCFSKVRYRRPVFRPCVGPSFRPQFTSTIAFKSIQMTYCLKPLHP